MDFHHGWIKNNKELLSKAFRKDMRTTGWCRGLFTSCFTLQTKTSLNFLMTPTISFEYNEPYFYAFSHALKTCPACTELSHIFGSKSQASVLKSLLLPYDPYEMNIGFIVGSQIKHPQTCCKFQPEPPNSCIYIYSNIIPNLMAIIFQVNDSTEFLHHLKASRNHPKQSEWQ